MPPGPVENKNRQIYVCEALCSQLTFIYISLNKVFFWNGKLKNENKIQHTATTANQTYLTIFLYFREIKI